MDIINNYIQNQGLNFIYDKLNLDSKLILFCDVITSFNKIGFIQYTLLMTGKYKLWFYLFYILLIA